MWFDDDHLFVIRDLAGLEHCSAIEYLSLGQGMVQDVSLQPLVALPNLRELHVCALCGFRDIDVVTQLPALVALRVVNIASSDDEQTWRRVVDGFNARTTSR